VIKDADQLWALLWSHRQNSFRIEPLHCTLELNREARLGLKPGYASRIRLGLVWKDHGSPFAGLMG
jgi:hypothetical protein